MISNFNELFAELKAKGICKRMIAAWGVDSHTIEAASLASDMGFVKVTLVGDEDLIAKVCTDCRIDISKFEVVDIKDELKAVSDKLIMCTDDGTYGEKGFTTVFLKQEIENNIKEGKPQFDRVIAIGPDIMMKFLADVTRPYGISTIISLDPIMVDGTGMCGGCRVIVGGETKFACVDGPDFDAHQVDFDSLIKRAAFYKDEQDAAAQHICNMTGGKRNG
jgi:hypothetical protein